MTFTLPIGTNNYVLTVDNTQTANLAWKANGTGNVSGPISSIINTIARYRDTSGKLITGSGVTIDNSNVMTVPNSVITTSLRSADTIPLDVSSGTTGDLTLGVYTTTGNIRPYRPFVAIGASLSTTLDLNSSVLTMSSGLNTIYIKRKTNMRISLIVSLLTCLTEFYLVLVWPQISIQGCIEAGVNTLTLDNNSGGVATLASAGGALSNFREYYTCWKSIDYYFFR